MASEADDTAPGVTHRRWNRLGSVLIGLTFAACSASASPATALFWTERDSMDVPHERVRELVLWFRYAGLVDSYISARSDGEHLFLPLGEIFSLLRVQWSLDAATAKGFFPTESRPYRIDFSQHEADVAGDTHTFGPGDFILSDREAYLATELIETWFGLRFRSNLREMQIALRTDEELPVERLSRRAAQMPTLHDPYAALRHAPLAYGRMRKDLGGGTFDYGVSMSQRDQQMYFNLDAALGAEMLGGDVQWRASGGYAGAAYLRQNYFLWRYALEDERLSQVRVGDLYSTGLENVGYRGVHFTNQPATPKTYFAEYQVSGEAPPGWEVELYLAERLVGVSTGDASGRYVFTVPLLYGTSMVRIKTYGPAGEEREEVQRLQIPFNMLAPGEMRYNVHAGRTRNSGRWMTQGDIGYGITDRVTATAGLDVIPQYESLRLEGSDVRDMRQSPVPYVRLASRLATHYLAGADFSPGGYRQLSLSGFLPSHASVDVRYAHFARRSAFMADGRRHMLQASGFVPFYVRNHPMSVRLHAGRTGFDRGVQHTFGSSLFAGLPNLRLQLASRGDWSDGYRRFRISPNVSYSSAGEGGVVPPGTMITAGFDYEVTPGRMERLRLEIAHIVRPWTRLRFTFDAGFNGAPSAVGFRLSVDLPYARSTTSSGIHGHGLSMTQSVRGSIAFDENNRQFYFDRIPVVGRSSAAVRLFVDSDGNGRYDPDERVIEEDAVRVRSGSAGTKRQSGDVTRISGLLPYVRYTVSVEPAFLSDPMLVPAQSDFSFIADPNVVKPIDIPLYNAGVVVGRVIRERDGTLHPVAGAPVRLIRRSDGAERTLHTFSDGTYYDMGLPPGTYDVMLDDEQRATRTFTIGREGHGAIVEGLDLVLLEDGEPFWRDVVVVDLATGF